MPCDFCYDPKPAVLFPAKDFAAPHPKPETDLCLDPGWISSSGWAACDTCAVFVQSENYDGLAKRAASLVPGVPTERRDDPGLIDFLKDVYAKFHAARTGPPRPMEGL
jgi:hypothetical protein